MVPSPNTSAAKGLGLTHLKGKRHQIPQGVWQEDHSPGALSLVRAKLIFTHCSNYRNVTYGAEDGFLVRPWK